MVKQKRIKMRMASFAMALMLVVGIMNPLSIHAYEPEDEVPVCECAPRYEGGPQPND